MAKVIGMFERHKHSFKAFARQAGRAQEAIASSHVALSQALCIPTEPTCFETVSTALRDMIVSWERKRSIQLH